MSIFLLYVGVVLGLFAIPFLNHLIEVKIPKEIYEKWFMLIETVRFLLVIGLLFSPSILGKLMVGIVK